MKRLFKLLGWVIILSPAIAVILIKLFLWPFPPKPIGYHNA
jgi:hypothetical protein